MSECKHPTCGTTCRRPKKVNKVYRIPHVSAKKLSEPKQPKKIYKIRNFSLKRAEENKEYAIEAKKFREENPYCAIKFEGCTFWTEGVNHTRGKATLELLMNKDYWEPGCNWCNGQCEVKTAQAKEEGHRVPDYTSKLSGVKKL